MANEETTMIENRLVDFGKSLGFIADRQVNRPSYCQDADNVGFYRPRYDVVWFLDLGRIFNLGPLEVLFKHDPKLLERLRLLPFVGFEVEDSSTSSKNQIGNFVNLHDDFIFNFEIVSSLGKKHKNDTYRRGLKIVRHFGEALGSRHTFFAEWKQVENSIKAYAASSPSVINTKSPSRRKKPTGGEKASLSTRDYLYGLLASTGMEVLEDYQPMMPKLQHKLVSDISKGSRISSDLAFYLKRMAYSGPMDETPTPLMLTLSSYYVPKIDIACGFDAPVKFSQWLSLLGIEMREDAVHFPLLYNLAKHYEDTMKKFFIPIVSVEIETTENKHMIGGCLNLLCASYIGILAGYQEGERLYRYLRCEKGFSRLAFFEIKKKGVECVEETVFNCETSN